MSIQTLKSTGLGSGGPFPRLPDPFAKVAFPGAANNICPFDRYFALQVSEALRLTGHEQFKALHNLRSTFQNNTDLQESATGQKLMARVFAALQKPALARLGIAEVKPGQLIAAEVPPDTAIVFVDVANSRALNNPDVRPYGEVEMLGFLVDKELQDMQYRDERVWRLLQGYSFSFQGDGGLFQLPAEALSIVKEAVKRANAMIEEVYGEAGVSMYCGIVDPTNPQHQELLNNTRIVAYLPKGAGRSDLPVIDIAGEVWGPAIKAMKGKRADPCGYIAPQEETHYSHPVPQNRLAEQQQNLTIPVAITAPTAKGTVGTTFYLEVKADEARVAENKGPKIEHFLQTLLSMLNRLDIKLGALTIEGASVKFVVSHSIDDWTEQLGLVKNVAAAAASVAELKLGKLGHYGPSDTEVRTYDTTVQWGFLELNLLEAAMRAVECEDELLEAAMQAV